MLGRPRESNSKPDEPWSGANEQEPSDVKDDTGYSCPAWTTISVEVLSASDETMALNAMLGVMRRFDHLPLQAQERMLRYMLERVQGP